MTAFFPGGGDLPPPSDPSSAWMPPTGPLPASDGTHSAPRPVSDVVEEAGLQDRLTRAERSAAHEREVRELTEDWLAQAREAKAEEENIHNGIVAQLERDIAQLRAEAARAGADHRSECDRLRQENLRLESQLSALQSQLHSNAEGPAEASVGSQFASDAVLAAEQEVKQYSTRLAAAQAMSREHQLAASQAKAQLDAEVQHREQLIAKYDAALAEERRRADQPRSCLEGSCQFREQLETLKERAFDQEREHQAALQAQREAANGRYAELEAHNRQLVMIGKMGPGPEPAGEPGWVNRSEKGWESQVEQLEEAWGRIETLQLQLREKAAQQQREREQLAVREEKLKLEEQLGRAEHSGSRAAVEAAERSEQLQATVVGHEANQSKLVKQLAEVTEALEMSTNEVTRLGSVLFEQSSRMEMMEHNLAWWKAKASVVDGDKHKKLLADELRDSKRS